MGRPSPGRSCRALRARLPAVTAVPSSRPHARLKQGAARLCEANPAVEAEELPLKAIPAQLLGPWPGRCRSRRALPGGTPPNSSRFAAGGTSLPAAISSPSLACRCMKKIILERNRMKTLQRLPCHPRGDRDQVCRVPAAGPAHPCLGEPPCSAAGLRCGRERKRAELPARAASAAPLRSRKPFSAPKHLSHRSSPVTASRCLISSPLARPQLASRAPTGRTRGAACSPSRDTPSSPCGCPRRSPSGRRSAGSAGRRWQRQASAPGQAPSPHCRVLAGRAQPSPTPSPARSPTSAIRWSSSTGTNLSCMPWTRSTGTASSAW